MIGSCFCTIAFQSNKWGKDLDVEVPIGDILPILSDANFDAAEVWWPHVAELSYQELPGLAGQLHNFGLETAMLSPYFDFTGSQQSARESVELGKRVLESADQLDSRGIRCFTGKVGSADADEAQWQRTVESLQELAEAGPDVVWALETHPRNLMDNVDATRELMQRVDRANVGLIFQPSTFLGHEMDALDALAPWIRHVHATNKRDGQRASLAEGEMDYAAIVQALRDRDFDGYISVEWMGPDPAEAARREGAYLRGLLDEQ